MSFDSVSVAAFPGIQWPMQAYVIPIQPGGVLATLRSSVACKNFKIRFRG